MRDKSSAENIFENKDLGLKSDLSPYVFEVRCPYLGLKNDRATILGFPHAQNNCFRHDSPIPVELKRQSQLCLTEQYESCAIFQQVSAVPADKKGTKELVKDAGSWLTGSTRAWIRHVRPALFALPVILLFIAALVWWPAPGTSVEDNTSNAAPLQKITRPNETIPATGSQVDATESESSQVDVQSGSGPGNSSQVEPETASQADVSPTAAAEDNEAAGQQSESFRVLTYD